MGLVDRRKLARKCRERAQTRKRCLVGGVMSGVLIASITFAILRSAGRAPAEFVSLAAVLGASYGSALAYLTGGRDDSRYAHVWTLGLPLVAGATALFAIAREV